MPDPLTIETLRAEAEMLLKDKGADGWTMRSCWYCNAAHEHLKDSPFVIGCPWCGHWFYKGFDITEDT